MKRGEKLVGTIKHIESHRNGISGNHFYAIHFKSTGDNQYVDEPPRNMIGIVTKGRGNCFVVEPANPKNCYRGDNFEDELREAVAQWVSAKFKHVPIEQARKELECEVD